VVAWSLPGAVGYLPFVTKAMMATSAQAAISEKTKNVVIVDPCRVFN
jgi:hypothetical protein